MKRLVLVMGLLCASAAFGEVVHSSIVGHEKRGHQDVVLTNKPLPPAEAKRLMEKLHRIRDLVLATPAVKELRDYDWETAAAVKNHPDAGRPVVANVRYIAFPYYKFPNGKVASSEEGAPLAIYVNEPEAILGQEGYNLDKEARFTTEPRSAGQLDGFPVYEGRFVVLSKRGQPVFVPVPQERYLARLIEVTRKDLEKAKATFKNTPDNPAVQQGDIESRMTAIKADRAEHEQRWAVMMPKWPDRVAAERAKFDIKEKKALDEVEQIRSSSPRERFLKPLAARLAALEAELAGLSPDERAAPAYLPSIPNQGRASGLAVSGNTDGKRIVTLNPALFDPRRPKSDIQVLVLGTTIYKPELFDQVQQQLDKNALMGLMD